MEASATPTPKTPTIDYRCAKCGLSAWDPMVLVQQCNNDQSKCQPVQALIDTAKVERMLSDGAA